MAGTEWFQLRDPLTNSPLRGTVHGTGDYRRMEQAHRGRELPTEPIQVFADMGRDPRDFIWVSLVPLIHQRVVDALNAAGCTGWSTYPVTMHGRKGVVLPDYHGLVITGRCASITIDCDPARLVYRRLPNGWCPAHKGLLVDAPTWDGSDLFCAADGKTGYLIVTPRLRELFRQLRITNVKFTPVEECSLLAEGFPSIPVPRTGPPPPPPGARWVESPNPPHHAPELVAPPDPLTIQDVNREIESLRPLTGDELLDHTERLGLAWAHLLITTLHWQWANLALADREPQIALVSPQRDYAAFPFAYCQGLLADATRENSSVLLFNLLVAGQLPAAKPGAFVIVT